MVCRVQAVIFCLDHVLILTQDDYVEHYFDELQNDAQVSQQQHMLQINCHGCAIPTCQRNYNRKSKKEKQGLKEITEIMNGKLTNNCILCNCFYYVSMFVCIRILRLVYIRILLHRLIHKTWSVIWIQDTTAIKEKYVYACNQFGFSCARLYYFIVI